MNKIEVLTAITGDKDFIRNDQERGSADWTVFSDKQIDSPLWKCKKAYDKFVDPRRNSRIHKLLIHKYSDADVTIWIDGNIKLLISPDEIVEKHLQNYDMVMFQHGGRDCIYDEAIACAKLGLDDPEIIIEQAKHYEDDEFAKHKGLCSGYFIVRRNNEKTRQFNEYWWADYCRYSRRDQIALMPALDRAGININILPFVWENSKEFASMGGITRMYYHAHKEGNFDEKK